MNSKDKMSRRILSVTVFFVIVCFIYAVKMVNIRINAAPPEKSDGTYTRTVPIQAVRGEIYDTNGNLLVGNSYTYDFVFDYEAMSGDKHERNIALLQAYYAIKNTGNDDKRRESSFPFDGTYPNYTYSSEARDTTSSIYYRLLRRIAADELEENSQKKKNELTVSYLEDFYKENPEEFPSEDEILKFFCDRYDLLIKNGDENVYTDSQIDILFRTWYDMEVDNFSPYNRYVMAQGVDLSFITYIKELSIVGADFSVSVERTYNYPGYASHILGRTGKIYAEDWDYYNSLGYEMDAIVGLDGCEYAFEEYLRGVDGIMEIVEDKNGRIIEKHVKKDPVPGKNVYLTIDIELQIAAEDGLRENVEYVKKAYGSPADAGALVAIDPNSGAVLATASYPTFDLTSYSTDYAELAKNEAQPLYNRALNGLYTPGSTFKLGMVAAGIDSGAIDSSTLIECDGVYRYYKDYQPRCWIYTSSSSSTHRHGYINATEALKVSCNCYFYELGRRMGIDVMNEYCKRYGLGTSTGIEIGDKSGILAGPEYRESNGLDLWTAGNTISAAIGQSDNNFTPIQISVYVSTLLNGGKRYCAHLLNQVKSYSEGEVLYTKESTLLDDLALSTAVTDPIKEGMRQMVSSSASVSSYMSKVPVIVGGKTGTAELGGKSKENGLFVCAAPYNNPEIVVVSVVEHAGGGSYAAMSAADVLEKYYENKN